MTERAYVCTRCDVKGYGATCWFCDKDDAFKATIGTQVQNAWIVFFENLAQAQR